MNRIFGKKKAEPKPYEGPGLQETSNTLGDRIKDVRF